MKYSLSIRQPDAYLRKTDEIKLEYKDKGILFEYLNKYPDQQFCIGFPNDKFFKPDWDLLTAFNEQSRGRLVIAFGSLVPDVVKECRKKELPFFWRYAVNNYYDLKGLKDLGVSQVHISGPLVHDLDTVKLCHIPVRLVPNVAYDPLIPKIGGISGQYVRPEDTDVYDKYITYFQFAYQNLKQERTFFDVYKSKIWNGNLAILIKDLKIPVDNRGIPDDFALQRIHCKQRCEIPGKTCRFCHIVFDLISAMKESNYKKRAPTEEQQRLAVEREHEELEFQRQQNRTMEEILNQMIDMKYLDLQDPAPQGENSDNTTPEQSS